MSGSARLGLISDTHGKLRPEILQHFAGVERILHAGDVGHPGILTDLAAVAPVTAVWGNTDGFDIRSRVPEQATLAVAGLRILVVHGHQVGTITPAALASAYPEPDVIVYGHTHRPGIARIGKRLIVNPGAAGPARFNLRPSVAILSLSVRDSPEVQTIDL